MSKHNALQMFGRSGNPALNDATFSNFNSSESTEKNFMTLQGTVTVSYTHLTLPTTPYV